MLRCAWCAAEETSGRQYAMKRMRKSAVVQCPEHVFCEQAITRNTAHPFCIRQYASFQVSPWHSRTLHTALEGALETDGDTCS